MVLKQIRSFAHYLHIISKLQRTIILNKEKFPELVDLQDRIIWTPLDKSKRDPLSHHLHAVGEVLKTESTNYTVRQLYHLFCKDVEAFEQEKELQHEPFYLSLVN